MNRNQKSRPVLGRKKTLAIIGAGFIVALALLGCPTDPEGGGIVPQELRGEWVGTFGTDIETITFSKNEIKDVVSTGYYDIFEPTSFTPETNTDQGTQGTYPSGYNFVGVITGSKDSNRIGTEITLPIFVATDEQNLLFGFGLMKFNKKP